MSDLVVPEAKKKVETIEAGEAAEIQKLLGDDFEFQALLLARLKRAFGCESFVELPRDQLENVKKVIKRSVSSFNIFCDHFLSAEGAGLCDSRDLC